MPKSKKPGIPKDKFPSKPRGKTPSLIGSSLGRPIAAVAGKGCACSRCKAPIVMGEKCYDIPRAGKKFRNARRFCSACFVLVLEETGKDLAKAEDLTRNDSPGHDAQT